MLRCVRACVCVCVGVCVCVRVCVWCSACPYRGFRRTATNLESLSNQADVLLCLAGEVPDTGTDPSDNSDPPESSAFATGDGTS